MRVHLASGFNGTRHIGATSVLIGRIMQYRGGVFGGFTNRYGVYRLVWLEMADTMAGGDHRRDADEEVVA